MISAVDSKDGSGMTMSIKTLCLAGALTFIVGGAAHAQTIATVSHAGLRVTLGRDAPLGPSYSLQVVDEQRSAVPMHAEAFTLSAPPRVVVDILDHNCSQARREPLAHSLFATIRFGVNPGKTRIVIDAPSVKQPLRIQRIVTAAGSVVVHFDVGESDAGKAASSKPGVVTEERDAKAAREVEPGETTGRATSVAAPRTGEDIAGSLGASKGVDGQAVAAVPAPKESPAASAPKAPAKVTEISFDWLNDHKTPALAIAARGLDKYSFGESRSNSYMLVIENARAANAHAIQTRLAPRDFGGFKAVTARREGDDIVIKIYVEKGTKLQPARGSGKLLVKAIE